jgi:hypothetical protein
MRDARLARMEPAETSDRPVVAPPRPAPAVSWGAIFAGAVVSAGVWLLLHVLGLGIGLTSVDPDDPSSLRGVGIGTGIWTLIAPIIALFAGGWVAGRLTGPLSRFTGAVHGAVVWSVGTIVGFVLLVMTVSSIVGGVVQTGSRVVGAGTEAAGGVLEGDTLEALGLSADDLIAPINQRLRAEGKPEVTAAQLREASRDALRTSIREGRVDREILVQSLAQHTALTREDANEIAATIQGRYDARRESLAQRGRAAQTSALEAAESTGKGLIGMFFSLLLGLAAAITGATLSVTHEQKRVTRYASALR